MYKRQLHVRIISLWLLAGITLHAQSQSEALTLNSALELAQQNNSAIQKSMAEVEEARGDNQKALAGFLPTVEVSNSFTTSNDPLYAFGFKLQQQKVTMDDFNPALLNNPGSVEHFNTQIMVQQPLINADAWVGKSAAQNKVKAMKLKSAYTKEHISLMVKQTYYAIQLAQKQMLVLEKAGITAAAYLKTAQENMAQGYLKEADLLSIKVRLNEIKAQVVESSNNLETLSLSFNFLVGRALQTPVFLSDTLKQVEVTINPITTTTNRADVMAMKYGVVAQQKMQTSALLAFAPRINAFGSYNLFDSEFPGTDVESWLVGVKLQWKLFNGGQNIGQHKLSKARATKASIEYNEYLTKENIELSKALRTIAVSESQLITYQSMSEQAAESLRIRTNRFNEGLEHTSDLLMAETKAAESQLKYLNAIYSFNMAVFKYQMLSSQSN